MWATHTLFKLPGSNCVSLVASPPLLKYLPTPLVGNPITKILDTPLIIVLYRMDGFGISQLLDQSAILWLYYQIVAMAFLFMVNLVILR